MKIILLKDIPKVGQKNTVKVVKDGFALNMLIPRGLAKQATPETIKILEKVRARKEENYQVNIESLKKKLGSIEKIEIKVRANEKGHLFAGISQKDIALKIGIPENLIIFYHPIKEVGQHEVLVEVGEESQKIKVVVSAE